MAIVKVHNKERNITYVYESISYWDKELKQPRSHRKLIGRIDPITGEIVQTGKHQSHERVNATATNGDFTYQVLNEQLNSVILQKNALIEDLQRRVSALEEENNSLRRAIQKIRNALEEAEQF